MRILQLAVLAMALAGSVAADEKAERLNRINAAFASWLKDAGASGALAIRDPSGAISLQSHGQDAADPVELASVSKSVTAICAAELVATGQLDWSDTLAELVGTGPDLPLSALITHTSGLKKDSTQKMMRRGLDKNQSHASGAVLEAVAARGGPKGRPGQYGYNNENYALAALMIEAATKRDYSDVCTELALKPAGVTGAPSARLPMALPWGAWTMTIEDYSRFHAHWYNAAQKPLEHPHADAGQGVNYGLGSFFRTLDRGNTFWHFGLLCFPGRMNAGSFAVNLFDQWGFVAVYDSCVDWDAMIKLDNGLVSAALGPLE